MRVAVLLPSEDHLRQAGVRIRYQRLEPWLIAHGHSLRLLGISEALAAPSLDDDIYVVSKCYDARAYLAIHGAQRRGKPIGIDVFDDYFSQGSDSRLLGLRRWLASMLDHVDFVLCSTPALKKLVERRAGGLPVHVLNDPVEDASADAIERALALKSKAGALDVLWFGMGDSLYFPVGLDDLMAFSGELARLDDGAEALRLTILTNQRALTADKLAALARLPVDHAVEEWSEAMEAQALARSHLVFLPVGAQSFSVAKSFNRVLTALTAGCQVLSVGYPLYEPFDDFIYHSPEGFNSDRSGGRMRLRAETVPALVERFLELASPNTEALRLTLFLQEVRGRGAAADAMSSAIVFGQESQADLYNLTRHLQCLSVRSPFSTSKRKFDLRVDWPESGTDLEVRVEARALGRVAKNRRRLFGEALPYGEGNYAKLLDPGGIPREVLASHAPFPAEGVLGRVGSYEITMRSVAWIAGYLFPPTRIFISEDIRSIFPVPRLRDVGGDSAN